MIDSDNILFKANQVLKGGHSLPQGYLTDLERALRTVQYNTESLDGRLDKLGVMVGGAKQAFSSKQRLDKIRSQVEGVMDSISDVQQEQVRHIHKVLAPIMDQEKSPSFMNNSRRTQHVY